MLRSPIVKVILALPQTTNGIADEYGGMPPNEHIGLDDRQWIERLKIMSAIEPHTKVVDLFGSGVPCTWQMLLEFAKLDGGGFYCTHDALLAMGNHQLFARWIKQGLKAHVEDYSGQADSMMKGLKFMLGTREFSQICIACQEDINRAFQTMKFRYALGIFHAPTIYAAANNFGLGPCENLFNGDGTIFIQLKNGMYGPYRSWKKGDQLPECVSAD